MCLTALLIGCKDNGEILDQLGDIEHIKLSAKELLLDNTASKQSVTFGGWTGMFTWMASASIPMV